MRGQPLLGVHQQDDGTAGAVRVGAGWTREFIAGHGGTPLSASTTVRHLLAAVGRKLAPAEAAGAGCLLSLNLDMKQVAAGLWDERLTAVGHALAHRPGIAILKHEPEDDYEPESHLDVADFVAGFARGRDAVKAGGPEVDVAYCAMAYQWRPGSTTTAAPAVWSSIVADLYLVDVYSGKTFPPGTILPEHPGFVRWYDKVIAGHPGRRWGVAERGFIARPARPLTWAREFEWLATDPIAQSCEVYLVWATPGRENNPGWLLDEPTTAAITAGFARLHLPTGYLPGPIDGVLVHQRTGVLVARDMTAAYDTFLETR